MFISSYRILRMVLVTLLLSFASFSAFGEQLIIKFSASINAQQSAAFLSEYSLEVVEKVEQLNLCTVAVPSGIDLDQLINTLESDARTKYVEKNENTGHGAFIPNDTRFEDQWHHNAINSQNAWGITRGSSTTIIAVLDSGLQVGNTDVSGERFLSGFDFVNNDNNTDDDQSHGTYVTGIITANADNNYSGVGVDHFATILPVKVLNAENRGRTFDLVQGINYAIEQGADVINMSLGGYPNASSLNDALSMARDKGIILVATSGNDGIGKADNNYPGTSPHTISVGATNIDNNRAFFSGTGAALHVVAPGSGVRTTSYPADDNFLDFFSGTSASAPIVTGVAALAKALNPDLTNDEFLNILTVTSKDQVGLASEDTPGRDDFYGWGLIDAQAVLERVQLDLQDNKQVTIEPRKDAYIRGGRFSDDNFGDNSNLVIKGDNNELYTREAYLQFGIGELSSTTVQKAVVRLYANRVDETLDIALHRIRANNASEAKIIWDNTPDEGSQIAVTSVLSTEGERYYEWDVTNYLKEKVSYNTFNVLLKDSNNIDKFVQFNSKEASSNRPQLVVTYTN